MKFFLPHSSDEVMAQSALASIKKFVQETTGWPLSDRLVYRLRFVHDGKEYDAEVGKVTSFNHEEVIAILESITYLVCTPNAGVLRGSPILCDKASATKLEFFEP